MDLAHLKIFYIIARERSLTKAAHLLNTSQSSLSRTLQTLEYYAKAQLFERHARGLNLTPQGEKVFQHAQKMVQEHEAFKHSFFDQSNEMEGELRIISTPYLASTWLPYHLAPFFKKYPKINPSIIGTFEDIMVDKADIAIRTFIPHHPHLIQKHFLSLHHRLWASEEYLHKHGIPKHPKDLDDHYLITFDDKSYGVYGSAHWILNIGAHKKSRKPYITCNSVEGLINLAERNLGIIETSEEYLNLKNHNLVKVLPDIATPTVEIYYIYSELLEESKKMRAFKIFMEENFK